MNILSRFLSTSLLVLCAMAQPLLAQDSASEKDSKEAPKQEDKKYFDLSGSVALTTDYISRGQSQTFGSAAVQGGLEANVTSVLPGFLIGAWGSNVSDTGFQNGADMEFDVYTGYAHQFNDDLSAKIVGNWCLYPAAKPTADPSQTYNSFELIPSVTYRWLTVLFAYSFTDKAGFIAKHL